MDTLSRLRNVIRLLFFVGVVVGVLLVVFTYLLSLLLGLLLFFFTPQGLEFSQSFLKGFNVYVFYTIGIFVPWWVNVGLLFLSLWGIFAACMLIAGVGPGESLLGVIRKGFQRPFSWLFTNCLFSLPILTSMLLLAITTVHLLQEAHGIPTGSLLLSDPFEILLIGSYASVAEEVSFRIIPIGVTSLAYVLKVGQGKLESMPSKERFKLFILAILYPEGVKNRLGLKSVRDTGWLRGPSLSEWLILVFSAAGFGVAHPMAGIGWKVGKVSTAFISGVTFGLGYLFYGAHAPILMHWFLNYYLIVYTFGRDFFSQLNPLTAIVDFVTLGFGILGCVTLSIPLLVKAALKLRKNTRANTPFEAGDPWKILCALWSRHSIRGGLLAPMWVKAAQCILHSSKGKA